MNNEAFQSRLHMHSSNDARTLSNPLPPRTPGVFRIHSWQLPSPSPRSARPRMQHQDMNSAYGLDAGAMNPSNFEAFKGRSITSKDLQMKSMRLWHQTAITTMIPWVDPKVVARFLNADQILTNRKNYLHERNTQETKGLLICFYFGLALWWIFSSLIHLPKCRRIRRLRISSYTFTCAEHENKCCRNWMDSIYTYHEENILRESNQWSIRSKSSWGHPFIYVFQRKGFRIIGRDPWMQVDQEKICPQVFHK